MDFSVDLSSLVYANDRFQAKLKYGTSMFSRERQADGTTVNYNGNGTRASNFKGVTDIENVVDTSVSDGSLGVTVGSRPSDDYDATWDLMSYYLMADFEVFDSFKILAGARAEDSKMKLNTFTIGSTNNSPIEDNAEINDDDIFASISLLYYLTENFQARLSAYETINRPDFREIANSFYFDPESGDTYVGNTNLVSAEATNIDLRLEYYFTDNESVSLAYFTKDFDDPIEKTLKTGGDVRSFSNGDKGELSGIEIDFRKETDWERFSGFVSGNFAKIDSEVDLIVGSTLRNQAMQGQPDNLANLQLGIDDLELGSEYTFLVNYQGKSLEAVSIGEEPNIFEESRVQLDFNYSQNLSDDLTLKAKLKNITDEEYELTQGNRTYRKYKKGTELSIGLSMPL
jgi:TonB-dependent receptor